MNRSNESFKNFVNNYKFTFVASIASILGLLLGSTIFFPPQKRPFYSVKSFNIINNSISKIENLDIKYKLCSSNQKELECKSENIQSLTVTRLLFWNGGRKKIDKTDVDDNPIEIVASDNNTILEAKVIHSSNDKTNFRLNSEKNTIHFNFLDSSNGGVIQVIHTGLSDENITLDGYVEESRFDGKIRKQKLEVSSSNKVFNVFYVFLFIVAIFLIFVSYYLFFFSKENERLFSTYTLSISFIILYLISQQFLPNVFLRYPSASYEVFSSEISK